jgi:hypothetical protein
MASSLRSATSSAVLARIHLDLHADAALLQFDGAVVVRLRLVSLRLQRFDAGIESLLLQDEPRIGDDGDLGAASFRVSLVRRSPFQASFPPMPEPLLRVHPLFRDRNSRNRRLQRRTAFSRFPPVHRADLEGQQRVELTRSELVSGTVRSGAHAFGDGYRPGTRAKKAIAA